MAKGAFEDMINKKYDTILKTYANKVDLRNYIETVNMRRCDETFFKDEKTQIFYMNKAGHNKFRFQDDYILNDTQTQFIEDFKEYLKFVAGECYDVESVVNFILDLMACYVQGIKTESILFIVGYYGCGKSFLHKLINLLLDKKYQKITKEMLLKYNSKLKGKTCGILEETEENNGKLRDNESVAISANLKDWTDSTFINERKMFNDDFAEFLNTINFVLLGNWTIPETYARRFAYFRMSSEKVGDKTYWRKMYNYLQNDENIYGLYLMLASRDVSKFGMRSQEAYENLDMPCKRNLKKEKISNVQRYLRDLSLNGKNLKGNRKDTVI